MKDNLKAVLKETEIDGVRVLYTMASGLGPTAAKVIDSDVVYAEILADEAGLRVPLPLPPFIRELLESTGDELSPGMFPAQAISAAALDDLVQQTDSSDWFAAPYEPIKAAQLFPDLAEHFVGVEEGWEHLTRFKPSLPDLDMGGLFFMEDNEQTDSQEFHEHAEAFATQLLIPLAEEQRHELEVTELVDQLFDFDLRDHDPE